MPRPNPCARRNSWSVARRSSKIGMASEGVFTGAETARNNGSPSWRMRRDGITYEDITPTDLDPDRRIWHRHFVRPAATGSDLSGIIRLRRSEEHTSELTSLRHLVCRL